MASSPVSHRVSLRVLRIIAQGRGAETHTVVVLGQATVLAAISTQAKVITKVKVVVDSIANANTVPAVTFEHVQDADTLSLTAGALGAVSVPLKNLAPDRLSSQDHVLVSSSSSSPDVRFVVQLELLRTVSTGPAPRTSAQSGGSLRQPLSVPRIAEHDRARAAQAPPVAQAAVFETVVLRAPSPPRATTSPPAVPTVDASDVQPSASEPSASEPSTAAPVTADLAGTTTATDTPAPVAQASDSTVDSDATAVRAAVQSALAAIPSLAQGPALPCRLVDYFAVMVSQETPHDPLATGDMTEPRRRTGNIQYRYPKRDHADCPLPGNVDWFAFPNGIAPKLQPTNAQSRPAIQHSVFVLSNVDGSGAGGGGRMYGCCLTAYRKEIEDLVDSVGDEGDSDAASGVTAWWPVVLFFLTRYPVVANLQRVLEQVYNVYDAGASTGAAASDVPPPNFCSLQEYLRMLVFEAPLPIRRAALGIELLLPGSQPQADAVVKFFLPAPDTLPVLQFDPSGVMAALGARGLIAALAALVLERRIVVVAETVQQLVEACETLLTLLYPLSWETPYIPVLPFHLAADCMSNPVPFLYGILSSYAMTSLEELSPEDTADIVVIDTVSGLVEVGVQRFLARHSVSDAVDHAAVPAGADEPLQFPEPLGGELLHELDDLVKEVSDITRVDGVGGSAAGIAATLQTTVLRFMAALLWGYRSSTFFPGQPPHVSKCHVARVTSAPIVFSHQFTPSLLADLFVDRRAASFSAAQSLSKVRPALPEGLARASTGMSGGDQAAASETTARARIFLRSLCQTQMIARLLQRHTSVYLRPFHALCARMSGNLPSMGATREWRPPVAEPTRFLVVPPPGAPPCLAPWQPAPRTGLRLLPHPAVAPWQPAPIVAEKRTVRKKDRRDDAELARRWTTGEVAAALDLKPAERDALISLVNRAAEGDMGPHGDDVGGGSEGVDTAASEAAALLAAAAKAVGSTANPVTGSQRRAPRRVLQATPATRRQPRARFGLFGGGVAVETTTAPGLLGDTSSSSAGSAPELVYEWLQNSLVVWAVPLLGRGQGSAFPASQGVPAGADIVHGVPWLPDDDRLLALLGASRAARAAFIRVLQAQVLLASGLSAPEYGTVPGATFVHAQASLCPRGSADLSCTAPTSADLLRTLLPQYVPILSFMRLAAVCAAILSDCDEDRDVDAAASLFQVAHFFFTEPLRDAEAAAEIQARGIQNTVSRSAWSLRRHSLHHELAREPAWRQFEVWDALLRHSHLTSLQGRQQRRLCGLTHASDRNSDDSPGIAMSILQSLVLPMVSMHLPFDDIATFIVRSCALYAISQGDEHALLGMLRALFSAEDEAAVGGLPALPPTLTTYEPFAAGQASSTSATAARSKSAVASVVPATASATRTGSLSSPPASTRALPIESASELLSGSHTRSVPRDPVAAPAEDSSSAAGLASGHLDVQSMPSSQTSTTAPAAAAPALTTPAAADTSQVSSTDLVLSSSVPLQEPSTLQVRMPSVSLLGVDVAPRLDTDCIVPDSASVPTAHHAPHVADDSSEGHVTPPPTACMAVAAVPHPWQTLTRKDAEAQAKELLGSRLYPPPPGGAIFALHARISAARKVPFSAMGGTHSAVLAATSPPIHDRDDARSSTSRPPLSRGASVTLSLPHAPTPARSVVERRGMTIVRKFGGSAVGLSVTGASFAASLPTPVEAALTGADLSALNGSYVEPLPLAQTLGVPTDGEAGKGLEAVPPPGSTWTTVDVGERGLLDAILDTLVNTSRSGAGAVSTDGALVVATAVQMSVVSFRGHAPGAAIVAMSYAPGDHRVATGGNDGRVVLWDMAARSFVHAYADHDAAVSAVRICGDVVVSSSQDGTIRVSSFARLAYADQVAAAARIDAPVASKGSDSDGDGTHDESDPHGHGHGQPETLPRSWGFASTISSALATVPFGLGSAGLTTSRGSHRFESAVRLKGHSGPVTALDVWERPEETQRDWLGRERPRQEHDPHLPRPLPCTSNYIIVSGGADGSLRTWAAKWRVDRRGRASGRALHLATHSNLHKSGTIIEHVRLSVDGRLCVSAGRDGSVGVVDVSTSQAWVMKMPSRAGSLFLRAAPEGWPTDAAVPTGLPLTRCSVDVHRLPATVTSAGVDGTVRVWDLRTGRVAVAFSSGQPVWAFDTVPAHGFKPASVPDEAAASPAPLWDRFLVSGHEDGVVRRWDSRRPALPLSCWSGHNGSPVTSLSTRGHKVISGCVGGGVRMWDAQTGLSILCDGQHSAQVSATAVADDYILSASWDGGLSCWFPTT